jgi:hypothetical protein
MKILKNRAFRTVIVIAAALLVISAGAGGYYILRVNHIKASGVLLAPTRPYDIRAVEYYLQNDPLWAGDTIGETSQSLGGAGCLISCAASATSELGFAVTPAEFNRKLTAVGGFSGANLIWYKIHEAIPEITYKYSRIFSSGTIERDLRQGLLPIVNVHYMGGGISHWVLIIGADAQDFLVYDPLNKDKNPITLSTHGKVYSYRVLMRSD